jgi:pimeloyl-ACP methyl ester carboxylesterase
LVLLAALLVGVTACDDNGAGNGSANGGTPFDGTDRPTDPPAPTTSGETQNVGIPFEDGDEVITLRGHLYGPQHTTTVVLAHMEPNDQRAWAPFAEELAREGYAALTFDFRGYGETVGDKDFEKLDDDLVAVLRYLRDTGRERVFLVGASMGGTISLEVAATHDVDGVVAVSPPAEFEGHDAVAAVARITAPKLFIASQDDALAIGFDELLSAAAEPKESELYAGNAHGTNLLESEHAAAFKARILRFLEEQGGH